jgi:hypothetical protein
VYTIDIVFVNAEELTHRIETESYSVEGDHIIRVTDPKISSRNVMQREWNAPYQVNGARFYPLTSVLYFTIKHDD